MPIAVTLIQGDAVVVYANAETGRLTGYRPQEIEGRPFWLEAIHPEDSWKLTDAIRDACSGNAQVAIVRILRKRQGPRLVEMHLFPASTNGDGLIEALAIDVTERSEVEEALFQSEALYRIFLEQSPIGMLHLDAVGTVTFENHQFRQIVGELPNEVWLGRSIYGIEGLDERAAELVSRMLHKGTAIKNESVTYRGASSRPIHHLTLHGSPIRQPEGGVVGAVLMVEDRTEQSLRRAEIERRNRFGSAEAALRRTALSDPSESHFLDEAACILGETCGADRAFLLLNNAAGDCCTDRAHWHRNGHSANQKLLILQDEEPALAEVNPGSMLYLDRDRPEAPGHHLLDLTGAAEAIWIPFWDETRLGGFVVLDRVGTSEDGHRPKWSNDESHSVEQLVRLFETLWRWILAGVRYRHITEVIDDCLFNFTYDEDGERRFLFLTSQIDPLTGYAPVDLLAGDTEGIPWSNAIVHEDDRALVDRHDDALRRGVESRTTYRILHADGSVRWLREQATPVIEATGDVVVSGILTDVSEQKEAERVLVEAKLQAESANQLKSAFIATMSHEIRTPMGALNGFAELLARELKEFEDQSEREIPPQITEFLSTVRDSSQKLLTLVNDLFDLSNLEEGSVQLRKESVSLNDVAMRSARKISGLLSEKRVELHVDLSSADPIVRADPRRLEQVLDNLLSNAAKFTEHGAVSIRTDQVEEGRATVEVVDTGIGMAPEYIDRLFDPFVQEDSRLNREFTGSGLGLSLVKRLLDLMNGSIRVNSSKGSGSQFQITLPLDRTAATTP